MKKIFIALVLTAALLVVSACGDNRTVTPDSVSASDASASDISASDASASDVSSADAVAEIYAPDGYEGCVVGKLYFCYPDTCTANLSETDTVNVTAGNSGAYFTVSKSVAVDMNVSELSKTDLDAIGEKSADELEATMNGSAEVEYTYVNHGTALDGAGMYFEFKLMINYSELEFCQELSFYQLYIADGKDIYMATFVSDPALNGSDAASHFADVISSVELNADAVQKDMK